jgi:hypothetical protein
MIAYVSVRTPEECNVYSSSTDKESGTPLGVRCLRGQNTWKKNAAQSGENQIEIGGITLHS